MQNEAIYEELAVRSDDFKEGMRSFVQKRPPEYTGRLMLITADDSHHALLDPGDDDFHQPTDERWFHETSWFWWFVPEHAIGGWFYNWVRPNIGTSGGGAWVWDASTPFHFEVPYYACYSNQPLDPAA